VTSTNERAGVWIRVSSGGQDEKNQLPDIERHIAAHGYNVVRKYELNDKSASKGEQQATLDEMLIDMREGTITVLVVWHSDRLERRGSEYLQRDIRLIHDADGRIESVKESWLGTTDISSEVMTSIAGTFAHQHVVHLAEQVKAAHDIIKVNGAVGPGGIPWGYVAVGPKLSKKLVATDLCRKYAPQIFARAIAGDSYRSIAAWLDSEGVPPKRAASWHEGSVRKLIRNRVYAGRWQNEAKTKTTTESEAAISTEVFDRANAAIKRQPYRKPSVKLPMLANLKCARCENSPMNRIGIKHRDGKTMYYYYRCTGRGAGRKGCGNMVRYDLTERIVHMVVKIVTDEPYRTRHWVEGPSYLSEISNVKQDMREAVEAEEFDRLPGLQQEIEELRIKQENAAKGHWEYEDFGLTVGEHFHSLDRAGQRDYLKTRDIRVEKTAMADGMSGVRLVLDGQDMGVIPYRAGVGENVA
jgi:DNA invertase Pin-like site-specific DNA recombinase